MACRAKQTFSAGTRVTSCVSHNARLDCEQVAFGIGANFKFQYHWMALHVVLRGLLARENGFHWTLQQKCCDCCLPLNGEFFFRSKSSAARSQFNFNLIERKFQNI